jgi:trk system potassium uptake protein TrkH
MLGILNVFGSLLALFSLFYVLPLTSALWFRDGTFASFATAALGTLCVGLLTKTLTRRYVRELKARDGYLLVVLAWTGMALAASIPLLIHDRELSFTNAYFEVMSGLTTTGATVFVGLDSLPPTINLWRHALNWFGGMGIIVLAVAVLPMLGVGGRQLYRAETPGPMKDTKLTPRITQTAKVLWLVYAGITATCIVSLVIAGMPLFDAICHAFATLSLGGFSTHDASVGYFNSPAIEAVLIIFMIISALNFATHFLAVRRLSFGAYAADPEARWVVGLILISCVAVALHVWMQGTYESYLTALRYVTFNLVSIATDCGFTSVDYNNWPVFAPVWMLFLSCVTVSSGSTGGGIKMFRSLILLKQSQREMMVLVHPTAVVPIRVGGHALPDSISESVLAFIFLYFTTVAVLTFALLISGLDFVSAFSAIIACINNMGPGLDAVGPAGNYAGLTDFQTWTCALAMLAGRIEIFTLLVLFTREFWRK